jgi:hypothetical protein
MQRAITKGRIIGAVIFISLFIILLLITDDWVALILELLFFAFGAVVGSFVMLGAFRQFGWGDSAARSVVLWTWVVGAVLVLVVGYVLGGAMRVPQPNLATSAFWTLLGGLTGAVGRAASIRRQLRAEDRP